MKKKIIKTDKANLPVGPYNQAVVIGHLVFCSGQIPIDPKTNEVISGGIAEQTRRALDNLKAVLEAAGTNLQNVVKTTVFLKNMGDFGSMNSVYAEYFDAKHAPARSTIEVARLPKDVLVEVEATASLD